MIAEKPIGSSHKQCSRAKLQQIEAWPSEARSGKRRNRESVSAQFSQVRQFDWKQQNPEASGLAKGRLLAIPANQVGLGHEFRVGEFRIGKRAVAIEVGQVFR